MADEILTRLVGLSRWLGDPGRDLAILGEGNTSAALADGSFYVKASGSQLDGITEDKFVRVHSAPLLEMVSRDAPVSDADAKAVLEASRADRGAALLPSVETFLHALLLRLDGVRFVGHTHPVSVNSILCSRDGWDCVQQGRLFPDEIVVCGIAPCYVPYTDPGIPLARAVEAHVRAYLAEYGVRPKALLMQNHGFIALGGTAAEVQAVTAMWDKTARILIGTMAFGGPNPLTPEHVARIYSRPDEHHRQRALGLTADDAKEKK